MMAPHVAVETVQYKVFLSGKSGVGKTCLAARLAGLSTPSMHYETTGGSAVGLVCELVRSAINTHTHTHS